MRDVGDMGMKCAKDLRDEGHSRNGNEANGGFEGCRRNGSEVYGGFEG